MTKLSRRPTITSPTVHIRSYNFRPFLALILTGCFLSFIGGYINAIGFISFYQTPRSATTGITSEMAIEFSKGNFGVALHFFLLLLSFVLGSFISAALIGGSSFRIQRPYGLVLLLESSSLAFSYLFEKTTLTFHGISVSLYIGAYLVTLACGLQNGMCTTFSGAVIRTTHVTGTLTDIGLILGQTIFHPRTRKHVWKLKVLVPLYISFCFGSIIGWFIYKLLLIEAILVPCALVGIFGVGHLCYCKIILMYKTKQINRKHWKRNNGNKSTIATIDIEGNTNNAFDKQTCIIDKDQQNEIIEILTTEDHYDLHSVTIHNAKVDNILL